ncbi:MAG TPA: hydrolase [Deltaproteobacteria bacterium]|nr:hydrolase [Deltaproteobacteria bacterium]
MQSFRILIPVLFLSFLLSGCARLTKVDTGPYPGQTERMGYTIQIGAFTYLGNAERLSDSLTLKGCEAYYFRDNSGLYKVRTGNFSTLSTAQDKASELKHSGIIDSFYIVPPSSYRVVNRANNNSLREEIVLTARNYEGIPYRWGGTSAKTGFDCSGLAMAVYQLNGLNLPRTSREQFKAGRAIGRHQLKKGDLVFFATDTTRRVSHVGIYTGRGRFIHAPGKGKKIRTDKLTDDFYLSTYAGARSFL